MIVVSERLIQLIKEFEGLRTSAYICPAGYKTIGYGHILSSHEKKDYIDEIEAEDLLRQDLAKAESAVLRNIKVKLSQSQFDALVSFTFNVGAACLQRSTLRHKINRNEHEDIPREFMRWIFSKGKILAGLVRRREIEANLYSS